MSSTPTEQISTEAHRKGGLTLLEVFMVVAMLGGMSIYAIWKVASAPDHALIAQVITSKIRADGNLQDCSVLINTTRHEGKCAAFGPYTALVGGRDLYVFSGPNYDPILVGTMGRFVGFRATQELADLALAE